MYNIYIFPPESDKVQVVLGSEHLQTQGHKYKYKYKYKYKNTKSPSCLEHLADFSGLVLAGAGTAASQLCPKQTVL